MPNRLWSKHNRTFTLFHSKVAMPAPMEQNKPMVLLFDIGGVCVRKRCQIDDSPVYPANASMCRWCRPSRQSWITKSQKEYRKASSTSQFPKPVETAHGLALNAANS